MSCFRPCILKDPIIDHFDWSSIISSSYKILEINLLEINKEELEFSNFYELKFLRKGKMDAILAWFDIGFTNIPNKVFFSTSPYYPKTHWKQVLFWTKKDFFVQESKILLNINFFLNTQ